MKARTDPRKPVALDLDAIRGNLVKLAGVQLALLVVVALFFALSKPSVGGVRILAWMGVLPLLVALWGWIYWRALARAKSEDGGTHGSVTRANASSLRALGLMVAAWAIGLVVVLVL